MCISDCGGRDRFLPRLRLIGEGWRTLDRGWYCDMPPIVDHISCKSKHICSRYREYALPHSGIVIVVVADQSGQLLWRQQHWEDSGKERWNSEQEPCDLLVDSDENGGEASKEAHGLARIIHERFCCTRRSAATTCLRPAGSPLGPSPYCMSTHRVLTAPRAGLATRLSDFATNRHE